MSVPHSRQMRPSSSIHQRLPATTAQRPPPLAATCQLAAHTGTPQCTMLMLTTCTPHRSTSANICNTWRATAATSSVHWHLQTHHGASATVQRPSHTTQMAHLDAHCTRRVLMCWYIRVKNCLETIQHSKCMLDMHHSFISSPDTPFENLVIEGEYILLHFIHYLHTFWSEGECCDTHYPDTISR